MIKNFSTLLFLLIQLIVSSCSDNPSQTEESSVFDVSPATAIVTYIVDGDTFYCRIDTVEDKIRVLGIDTYETQVNDRLYQQAQRNGITPDSAIKLGEAAKNFATELLRNKIVILIRDFKEKNKDVYNRYLRYVIIDNMRYDSLIIAMGYNAN
jgi:micrococcal nuclease